jgi:large subunit ribosomal protein L30
MYAIVRLRGGVRTKPEINDTLDLLHMNRVNHCVVVKEDPHYRGMIQKVKDYVAWGIKEKTAFGSIKEFAKAVNAGSASLKDLGIKPVFRLHPARKGLKSTKKSVPQGGVLGFHKSMNDLITKMR